MFFILNLDNILAKKKRKKLTTIRKKKKLKRKDKGKERVKINQDERDQIREEEISEK